VSRLLLTPFVLPYYTAAVAITSKGVP
jgi:hypothetical protein